MEIINPEILLANSAIHTATLETNIPNFLAKAEEAKNNDIGSIEIDCSVTRDKIIAITHNFILARLFKYQYYEEKNIPTLDSLIKVLLDSTNCNLVLDFKCIPKSYLYSDEFSKKLDILNDSKRIQIITLQPSIINRISNGSYPNIKTGIIMNVLTRGYINEYKIPNLSKTDAFYLSKEYWNPQTLEKIDKYINQVWGKDKDRIKKIAWTWSRRIEDEKTLENFIELGADGIVTGKPELLNSIVYQKKYKSV